MEEKNKEEKSKFNFVNDEKIVDNNSSFDSRLDVTLDRLKDNENITIKSIEKKVKTYSNKKEPVEDVDSFELATSDSNGKIPFYKKIYFNYELRVITLIIITLLLFSCSGFLFFEGLNLSKGETIKYDETSNVTYNVCLDSNNYYNDSCLGEGMEYVTSITNMIDANFHYDLVFSQDITYALAYHVVAVTKIYDRDNPEKVLYQNEETIVDQKYLNNTSSSLSFNEKIQIDYRKYNTYVINYKNNYSLSSSASLEIIFYLDEPNETRKVSSLLIPLGDQTFGITKDIISNKNKVVEIKNETFNDTNSICCFVGGFLLLVGLIVLIRVTKLILKVINNKNKYQTKLTQILREYDRIIVIARDGYESNVSRKVIKVDSFLELLDARDALEKPIIYSKVNAVKSEFIVEDDDKLYKFVMKESDFVD